MEANTPSEARPALSVGSVHSSTYQAEMYIHTNKPRRFLPCHEWSLWLCLSDTWSWRISRIQHFWEFPGAFLLL
jgi:hypothetical protein